MSFFNNITNPQCNLYALKEIFEKRKIWANTNLNAISSHYGIL